MTSCNAKNEMMTVPIESTNFKKFSCQLCNVCFEKYVPPSSKSQVRLFCSRSCQMKSLRNSPQSGNVTIVCKHCNVEFTKYSRACRPTQYCSKSCRSKHAVQLGQNCFATAEKLISVGKRDLSKSLSLKKSQATIARNTGHVHSEETKQKISASCTGIPNALKGKTFEEFYGKPRAKELTEQHSRTLKEGYASGKLTPTARSRSAPVFRGVKLRSKLEQQAIEFLERRDGLVFGQTLLYEDKATRTTWVDSKRKSHTYHPDLHDVVNNVVYEVKPSRFVKDPSDEMIRKSNSVTSSGHTFRYLTDEDIRKKVMMHVKAC